MKTCVDVRANLMSTKSARKSSQVNASARKAWPNGVASSNLRLLSIPFGQGFRFVILGCVVRKSVNVNPGLNVN